MFSSSVIGLLVAASVFAWSYSRFMRTTGNNNQKAITGAALVAILAFVAVLLALYFIDQYLIDQISL